MRRYVLLVILAVAILAAGVGAYIYGSQSHDAAPKKPQAATAASQDDEPSPQYTYQVVAVTAGAKTYQLQLADTSEKQSLGLGERKTIGGDGMIFPYSKPQRLCFWMKDMHFPIDMVWLDADKQVIKLEAGVSPDTYPRTTYCQENTQYVVELDSGQAAKSGIAVGSKLDFTL